MALTLLLLFPISSSLAVTATPRSVPPHLPPQYSPGPSSYHKSYPYKYGPKTPTLKHIYNGPPACSSNSSRPWCLYDLEYPTYEVQHAIEYHYGAVAALYKDVIANTDNSVDRLEHKAQETYLCPSDTNYVTPLRAVNTDGRWRIIVNQVKAHYEHLSQTVRVEECSSSGRRCALVPECYETKCLQKSTYHRFLVYDPADYYFPFTIESFKLPASCACFNGGFAITH